MERRTVFDVWVIRGTPGLRVESGDVTAGRDRHNKPGGASLVAADTVGVVTLGAARIETAAGH